MTEEIYVSDPAAKFPDELRLWSKSVQLEITDAALEKIDVKSMISPDQSPSLPPVFPANAAKQSRSVGNRICN